ncbi:hypothetical protein PFFVO_01770 [Plasmodium falciparum Vietnam Oak-Knoll (FVO)]|uniref:non-specific serine/threonine protein kinase n=1 Tax=Plasmodium falciparum Vietnam Oak-Knoll (FVO) TaxID=1036723 RepID=A0A024V8U0_PLAFA|nr:hypothetical protein PFFVO_01770 [Plasmodium falciparum Vietnam Oak-Knoll (FVO)]
MNKYEKIRDIGKGNYGNTILVRDRKNDHYVMKIINISQMSQKEKRQCLKEVELLSKLNHPFIVKYIESYIEGDTLRIIPDLPNIYSKELNNIYKSMLIREPSYRATVQQLLVSDIVQRQLKLLIEEKIREKQSMKKPLKEKPAIENENSGANEQEVKTLLLDVVDT